MKMIRSENRSVIKMKGRRGSRLWSEKGGEVWMEVNKACLMRCAVSGQRPGSLIALRERKLTEGGRKRGTVVFYIPTSSSESEEQASHVSILCLF